MVIQQCLICSKFVKWTYTLNDDDVDKLKYVQRYPVYLRTTTRRCMWVVALILHVL
jgi:hypothetical protein